MRNLKRVLSLALALVMVLGMMVIGTSAATYTDADEITYTEAVDVMSGLDVFEGIEAADGTFSFNPNGGLTREQAATLMARVHSKGQVESLTATKPLFDDVNVDVENPDNTRWSAKYIEYCYDRGLIDGLGNGKFDPAGELTGIAFAKLLLVAMGYDADAEGYVGKDWATSIAVDALDAGLYIEGVDITKALNREQAAQMLLQALEQDTVAYSTYFDKATNAPVLGGSYADGNTFMGKYFPSLRKVAGTITDTTASYGTTTLTYTVKEDVIGWWGQVVDTKEVEKDVVLSNTAADWSKVGYAAYAWYLDGKKADTALYLGITGKEVATSNDGTPLTGAYSLTYKSAYNPYYVASMATKGVKYVLNGEFVTAADIKDVVGTELTLVDNNKDGYVDLVSAIQYTAATVDAATKISVTGTVYDYVYSYTNLANDAEGYIYYYELANVEALSPRSTITFVEVFDNDEDAALTGYNAITDRVDLYYINETTKAVEEFSAITWLTVGGSKVVAYTLDGVASVTADAIYTDDANYSDLVRTNLNEDLTVVYDHNGYILSAKVYADPDAYVLVLDNEDSHGIKNLAETEVAFIDGTVTEINVACKTDVEDGDLAEGYIYTYATNKAGNIELTDIADVHAVATYVDNSIYFDNVQVTNKTTFIDLRDVLKGKASVGTVYNGYLDLPGITNAEIVYTIAKNGSMDLCFIVDGTNTANLKDSFVVFNTEMNVETAIKAGKGLVYTYTLTAGVISNNELVPAYELTEKQAKAIATYGVGEYTFGVDGELAEYVSFEADSVIWKPESTGRVVYNNVDITDAYSMHFLDISAGKYHNWTQLVVDGEYYAIVNPVKKIAYIVADATKNETDPDYTILASGTAFTGYDGNLYTVATGYVTDVEPADVTTFEEAVEFATEVLAKAPNATTIDAKKALVNGDLAKAYARIADFRNTGDAEKDKVIADLYAALAAYSEQYKADIAKFEADLAAAKVAAVADLKTYAEDVISNHAWSHAANLTAEELAAVVNGAVSYTKINNAMNESSVAIALEEARQAVWDAVKAAQAVAKAEADLKAAKEEAIENLAVYADSEYKLALNKELNVLMATAIADINAASDEDGIEDAIEKYEAAVDQEFVDNALAVFDPEEWDHKWGIPSTFEAQWPDQAEPYCAGGVQITAKVLTVGSDSFEALLTFTLGEAKETLTVDVRIAQN